MPLRYRFVMMVALLLAAVTGAAQAQAPAPAPGSAPSAGPAIGAEPGAGNAVYVLTHVDVFPAGKDQTIEMLKQLAEASRKESGNLRLDVLQQEGRLNHLPLVEAWRDAGAQRGHAMAEHARAFRAKLVPLQGALYDERLYTLVR